MTVTTDIFKELSVSPVARPAYLAIVEPYIDQPLVKVLTGLRRSGKSTLLALIGERLHARGVQLDHVLHMSFDSFELGPLTTASALHEHIVSQFADDGRYYLLLDEIQEVAGWEKVVNSLLARGNTDIYLTGSNSRLLSSELATYIAGRYVTIEVSTLSFAEYVAFNAALAIPAPSSTAEQFGLYLRRGGFPGLFAGNYTDSQLYQAVNDILPRHCFATPLPVAISATLTCCNGSPPSPWTTLATRFQPGQLLNSSKASDAKSMWKPSYPTWMLSPSHSCSPGPLVTT